MGDRRLVFLDGETTGLDRENAELWELGIIARTAAVDLEYCWQLRPHMQTADPQALAVGRFYDRFDSGLLSCRYGSALATSHPANTGKVGWRTSAEEAALEVARLLDGAVVVGCKPWFDERFLQRWLREHHQCASHHYGLVDAATYAAGYLGLTPPWRLDDVLADLGLSHYEKTDRHTALGDARMVRDLWDAVHNLDRPYLLAPETAAAL